MYQRNGKTSKIRANADCSKISNMAEKRKRKPRCIRAKGILKNATHKSTRDGMFYTIPLA